MVSLQRSRIQILNYLATHRWLYFKGLKKIWHKSNKEINSLRDTITVFLLTALSLEVIWPSVVHCISLEFSQAIFSCHTSVFHGEYSFFRTYLFGNKIRGSRLCLWDLNPTWHWSKTFSHVWESPVDFTSSAWYLPHHFPLSSVVGTLLLLWLLGVSQDPLLCPYEGSQRGSTCLMTLELLILLLPKLSLSHTHIHTHIPFQPADLWPLIISNVGGRCSGEAVLKIPASQDPLTWNGPLLSVLHFIK